MVGRCIIWFLSLLSISGLTACGSGYFTSPAALAAERAFDSQLNATTVFMGDSITYRWPLPLHNAGVPGAHTGDMLDRFSADVLGHGYSRVVILAGTNDIWFNSGTLDEAIGNIATMAAAAKSAGIDVVLCTIPPLNSGDIDRTALVTQFNDSIRKTAAKSGYLLSDYYPVMFQRAEYFVDGVHPNTVGYEAMHAALSLAVAH